MNKPLPKHLKVLTDEFIIEETNPETWPQGADEAYTVGQLIRSDNKILVIKGYPFSRQMTIILHEIMEDFLDTEIMTPETTKTAHNVIAKLDRLWWTFMVDNADTLTKAMKHQIKINSEKRE